MKTTGTPAHGYASASVRPSRYDRLLRPLHRWVWSNARRRAQKLLRFAETEADGGRDIARASERTDDSVLRRAFLRHALDEQKHANLFRRRGRELLAALPKVEGANGFQANWFAPGERGLDDLDLDRETDSSLLAFLHLSEKSAAQRFVMYEDVLSGDPATRQVFTSIGRDEVFHMSYTLAQLKRVAPRRHGLKLWGARLHRLWKGYLRVASAVAGVFGWILLALQYFVILPIFALMAKRKASRELPGWVDAKRQSSLRSQY